MQNIAMQLELHHQALQGLCDRLEELADDIPKSVDRQYCLHLARMIHPLVKTAHEFEENVVFKALQSSKGGELTKSNLERLQFEHWEDESYAIELSESLFELATGRLDPASEYFGYMLRGFFESMRRHIAFEAEYIGPMLKSPSATETAGVK